MEKSLFDKFIEYGKHRQSYYGIRIDASKLFSGDNCEKDNCREFIKQHFETGHKDRVLYTPWQDENGSYKEQGKHTHTVSLYLLALLLENDSGGLIELPLQEAIRSYCCWGDYRYTWFLTCLYHDIAAHYERVDRMEWDFQYPKMLNYHLHRCNIQHTIYDYTLPTGVDLQKWEPRFPEELLFKYFWHQIAPEKAKCDEERNPERDHGILGGYFLFDSLYKEFTQETQGHNWRQEPATVIEGLQWCPAHLNHFACISDAIICHNLWTANIWPEDATSKYKEDQRTLAHKYRTSGLDSLIIKAKEERVSFQKYPLQFLLYLFDSIEPVKRFTKDSNRSAKEVLQNISIEYCQNEDKHTIKLTWNYDFFKDLGFDDWCTKISELQYWMDVETEKILNGITLSFPKWIPRDSLENSCVDQPFETEIGQYPEDDSESISIDLEAIL